MAVRLSMQLTLVAFFFGLAACGHLSDSQRVELDATPGEVTVHRDEWGVPHVYALTEDAGYFGLGYAQAQDQGERFMRMILFSVGRLAAVDGESALASDIEARRWMHEEEAERGFLKLARHVRANYRAFARGFNHYFDTNPSQAPKWRFEVEAYQLVAVPRGILFPVFMANDGLADCRRDGVKPETASASRASQPNLYASNEWVIHPERTADNAMILLSDPHSLLDGGIFYEYRLHAGELHSAGYSFGGTLMLAHNRHLSWGMTTGAPDLSDCYVVQTDPENPMRYRFDDDWEEITTREVELDVQGRGVETRRFEYTNHNGVLSPVVARKGNKAWVVSTPYMHNAGALDEEIDRLNHAVSVDGAKDAMRSMAMFGQNLMFADSEGNSWYVRAGRAPVRRSGYDWRKPVPGGTSKSLWLGIHSIDDLVQTGNPPHGYMQNNNLAPDQMTLPPALIDPSKYPAYLYNDKVGRFSSRGARAKELLSRAENVTVEEAIEMAMDEKWPATEAWLDELQRAAKMSDKTGDWDESKQAVLREILTFDGFARAESSLALKYYFWRQAVHQRLGEEAAMQAMDAQWSNELDTIVGPDILLDAIGDAVDTMEQLFGTTDRALGEFARFTRPNANFYGNPEAWVADLMQDDIARVSYPIGGIGIGPKFSGICPSLHCELTLRAYWSAPIEKPQDSILAIAGSRSLRLVVFTDPIQSFTMHIYGQSDDPQSAHYDDQARLLASQRKVKPVYFEWTALQDHIESTKVLTYDPD